MPRRTHKYNAKAVRYDGYRFDSQMEYKRYLVLRQWHTEGKIMNLEVHPPRYELTTVNRKTGERIKVKTYIADFRYSLPDGEQVVEDVKGVPTPEYKIKRDWMLAEHGISIFEIKSNQLGLAPWEARN